MSDLIREALENLVRQQDGHPRSLEKLRRQGLSPDHPTVTATMEGHRLMMDRAWQQAREAISRTPYPSTRQQEVGSDKRKAWEKTSWTCALAKVSAYGLQCPDTNRCADCPAAPSTPENADGGPHG